MDLKQKLQETAHLSGRKHAHPILVYLLGLFGLAMVVVAAWLYFTDSTASRAGAIAAEQGGRALEQIAEPIQSLKRVIEDEQVHSLALRAIEDPQKTGDLFAYVNGRVPAINAVSVYSPEDVVSFDPAEHGANGYALLDLVLSANEGKQALMQVHDSLQPPLLFDATAVRVDGEIAGVLLISADPGVILQHFEPDTSSLGFIRLAQYNGRQPSTVLKSIGDESRADEVPERLAVPGTTFRIEYPQPLYVSTIGGSTLLLMLVAGLAFIVFSVLLHQNNRKRAARAEARPEELEADESLPAAREEAVGMLGADPKADADFAQRSPESSVEETPEESGPQAEPEPEPPVMHLHYDIAERRRQREAAHPPVDLTAGIFRAYDIRGVIDKTLDSGVARSIGQAVGSLVLEREAGPVVVARDGRLSGPYLMKGVIEGIVSTGCDVMDIGAVPTGVLYYAAHEFASGSAVMITGSHNPPDYNGFKIMVGGDTLHGEAIMALYERIVSGQLKSGKGQVQRRKVIKDYIRRISEDIKVEKPLRVVIDCGNGIGGVCAADVLRAIGAEVLPLYDEVDGTFPNHHPDPSEPENLTDLIESVRLMDADLGLALDGDADRLGVVTLAGHIIYPDRVMMLLALDVLDREPGATILYDVKCTGHLPKVIREAGGNPVMYKTGHSLMKARMKEVGAPFAGEMSGHFFFGERWYGVDDGIYAAARLLEILGGTDTPPEAILNALPTSYSTPELKVEMEEGENHAFVEAFKEAVAGQVQVAAPFEGAQINTIDGLRADFEDGWGLVRPSNTTPVLVVRFDAETEQALERIKALFRRQMLELNPDLELPF
jgi:phosphomannomutase/phosphoglucomutase